MDTEPLQLPVVRLAPYDELAEAVRKCEQLGQLRRLATWVGDGRKVTKRSGALTLPEARKAVQHLHLPSDQDPGRTLARSAREVTELQDLWDLARDAELLVEDGGLALPGPAFEVLCDDEDEEIVDVWADMFRATLDRVLWLPQLGRALVPVLMTLYVSPRPIPARELTEIADAAGSDVDEDDELAFMAMVNEARPDSDELVEAMVDADGATSVDGNVCLTPLGRYGLNCWLESVGVDAPAVSDLRDATAAELIDLGYTADGPGQLDALFNEWTAARGGGTAAADLVAYAVVGDAQQRMTAFSSLDRIGPAAEEAVRRGLESKTTGPHARAWLAVRGLECEQPDLADLRWLFADTVVAAMGDDVDGIRQSFAQMDVQAEVCSEVVAELWRSDHPQKVEALEALVRHHPDDSVVRAAQKALLQARSPAPAQRRSAKTKTASPKSAKARAKAKTAAAKAAWAASACQLKITLLDVRPEIWRRIIVPATITLPDLHRAIQTAMGWTDSHLHEFGIDGIRYGLPSDDFRSSIMPEAGVRLLDKAGEGSRVSYVYDFGDDWRHDVHVEKVLPEGADAPACLAGRRACPPEDSGGPSGYADLLAAYADPAHPDHEHLREWAGDGFEPDHFDPAVVTARLQALLG